MRDVTDILRFFFESNCAGRRPRCFDVVHVLGHGNVRVVGYWQWGDEFIIRAGILYRTTEQPLWLRS